MHTLAVLVALTLARPQPTPLPLELADVLPDGGAIQARPFTPSMAVIAVDDGFVFTWVDGRRHDAFDAPRPDTDVWVNTFYSDGGVAWAYGALSHRSGWGEVSSQPRLASGSSRVLLAWRTTPAGATEEAPLASLSWGTLRSDFRVSHDLLAPGTVRSTSLELAAGPGGLLATWETPDTIEGRFWDSQQGFSAPRDAGRPGWSRPSAAAGPDGGFVVLWQQGTVMRADVTPSGFGAAAAAWGPVVTAPHAARFLLPSFEAGLLFTSFNPLAGYGPPGGAPMPLDVANRGPVFGALSAKGGHVVYSNVNQAQTLRAVSAAAPGGTRVALPPGWQVQAIASGPVFDLALAVRDDDDDLQLIVLDGTGASITNATLSIARGDDELYPSAAGLEDGSWYLGMTSSPRRGERALHVRRLQSTAFTNTATQPLTRSYSLVASPGGQRVLAHLVHDGGTTLVPFSTTGGAFTLDVTSPVLTTPSVLPRAAVGDELALAWEPATGAYFWSGSGGSADGAQAQGLGACGAWTDDGVFFLPLGTAATFSLFGVRTGRSAEGTAPEELTTSSPLLVEGSDRCLAIHGARVLLATSRGGKLQLYRARLSPAGLEDAVALVSLVDGSQLLCAAPSLVPLDDGWLLAWEERTGNGTRLKYAVLDDEGSLGPVRDLSNQARDARRPTAVRGPAGDVVITWHEFDEEKGRSQMRAIRVDAGSGFLAARDAGVMDAGGSGVDGGSDGPDAGFVAGVADGGVDPVDGPATFASCGCGVDAGLALLAAALLGGRRRSRRRAA